MIQTVRLSDQHWSAARELLTAFDASSDHVTFVQSRGLWNQGDVAKASGLNPATLKALKDGKKPTKAQLAALKHAMFMREMNLYDF